MAEISLSINDRSYQVACDDGQEPHVQKLAEHLDERVRELATRAGQIGEPRLLVMASLQIADELYEAYKQIHALESGAAGNGQGALDGDIAAQMLEACAQRVETLAARLQDA